MSSSRLKGNCFKAVTLGIAAVLLLVGGCTKDNPLSPSDKDTYTYSGYVIDGYTGARLAGSIVSYVKDGKKVSYTTGSDAAFEIEDIPYGNRSFHFLYTSEETEGTVETIEYTTVVVTVMGENWENLAAAGGADTLAGLIRDISGSVKLYPLAGSLSGKVVSQAHGRAAVNPVADVVVKATFSPPMADAAGQDAMQVEYGPSSFQTRTDTNGAYTFSGLPVGGKDNEPVTVQVVSVDVGGLSWEDANGPWNVVLASGQTVPMQSILMTPIVVIPLAALDDNFKSNVIGPDQSFVVTFSDNLDDVSYATLTYQEGGVGKNVPVTATVSGAVMTIVPAYSLVDGQAYTLTYYYYGTAGQSGVSAPRVVTVSGGGLAEVLSSNMLTDAKVPVYNFGITDSITFTFTQAIKGNPSVRVTNAGGDNVEITVTAAESTLTVKPRTRWIDGSTIAVQVTLEDNKPVSFTSVINTANALAFVTSNVYDFDAGQAKNGLVVTADLVFVANKELSDASVIFFSDVNENGNIDAGDVVLPVVTSVSEETITISPVNLLKPATSYTVEVTANTDNGETVTKDMTFKTTANPFYVVSSNVRIGGDRTIPVLDLLPDANIIIVMSQTVNKASAVITGGTNPDVSIRISDDTITIDPKEVLMEGVQYDLDFTAQTADGASMTETGANNHVDGFMVKSAVYVVSSNVITADGKPVANAAKSISPYFVLNVEPVAASIRADNERWSGFAWGDAADLTVSVSDDTLVFDPAADYLYDDSVQITVTGTAADGNHISFKKQFRVMKAPTVSIVASNVLNSDFNGLTNVAENISEIWYLLSRTPDATSLVATIEGANVPVSASGDTVKLTPLSNFTAAQVIDVTIDGLTSDGLTIDLDPASFTIRAAVFPVASNSWDINGNDAKNFTIYDEMWVKYSEDLNTDLSTIDWGNNSSAANNLIGEGANANATVRVSGDTLFVKPLQAAVSLTYGSTVGFNVEVKNTEGKASNADNFTVTIEPSNVNIIATNTRDGIGQEIDTLGPMAEVWVVSSKSFTEVIDFDDEDGSLSAANEVVAATIRTSGDTIFYKPVENLGHGTNCGIDFDIKLTNGVVVSNVLRIDWTTRAASNPQVIATNTIDANGDPVETFELDDTMWVVCSEELDSVYGMTEVTANLNAVNKDYRFNTWVNGDTIFYSPVDSLGLGTTYSINFNIALATGETYANVLTMTWKTKAENDVYVLATNTLSAGQQVLDTFSLTDVVWLVVNTPFSSVDGIATAYTPAGGAVNSAIPTAMRVLANVSTSGDTIFFTPPYALNAGTRYGLEVDITLPNTQQVTSPGLRIEWETKTGIEVVSTNDMNSAFTQYRQFTCNGDSLVVEFSVAIDTSSSAPTQFSITGYKAVADLTFDWSANLKTVTIKDTTTAGLATKAFGEDDLSTSSDEQVYGLDAGGGGTAITFALTTVDGEQQAALDPNDDYDGVRPNLCIHTEQAIALVDANYLVVHNLTTAVAAGDNVVDDWPVDSALMITFSRAVDTNTIKNASMNTYFRLYNTSVSTSIPLDYTLTFSSDGKTVTITPAVDMETGDTYHIAVLSVPALSNTSTISGAAGSNYVVTAGFTIVGTSPVTSIASIGAPTIALDTNSQTTIGGNRRGASAEATQAGVLYDQTGAANIDDEGNLGISIIHVAWNENHADSVDGYQFRVRKVDRDGNTGDWHIARYADRIIRGTDYSNYVTTGWNKEQTNSDNAVVEHEVDIASAQTIDGATFIAQLRTADYDGAGTDWLNGNDIFNDSSQIELQIRAVLDINTSGEIDAVGEFGVWSSTLAFADNVAPCDSDFVGAANCNTIAAGGVTVVEVGLSFDNSVGGAPDSTGLIRITFPEDMDTSTAPEVTFFYGTFASTTDPTTGPTKDDSQSGWTSGRVYDYYVAVPVDDYTDAGSGNGAFYNVSVAGMKDASGNEIQAYGDNGDASTSYSSTISLGAVAGQDQGSNSVILGFVLCD